MHPVREQNRFKRILAGTDFTPPAASAVVRAAMLAAEHSASLEIVHVTRGSRHPYPQPLRDLQNQTMALVSRYIAEASLRIVRGRPATILALEAARFGADLIVVGCRRKRSLKDGLIGTTAERLLGRWTGDTLIVRNPPESPYRTILACVALDSASCSVVNSALALSPVARLSIVHAYRPLYEKKLISHHAERKFIRNYRTATRQELARKMAKLLEECSVPVDRQEETILKYGSPFLIPDIAARMGTDVIVLGNKASAVSKFLFGSVTKHVLRSAVSDVLVASTG